jgi:drug/metabolite transporter (DMT)-like permease
LALILTFGTFITSFSPVVSKMAYKLGSQPASLLGWVSLFMSVMCFSFAYLRGEDIFAPMAAKCAPWLILLSIILTVSVFLYYEALSFNAIRVVVTIWTLQAVLASVWGCFVLKEVLPWSSWVAFVLASGAVYMAVYHR